MRNVLPHAVEKIVQDLSLDEDVNEVWLIGSQASANATETSDWDLLVFSRREPSVRSIRSVGVDVLWCGPSGRVLLEGQPEVYILEFHDFYWEEYKEGYANYKGRRFADDIAGDVRDSSDPLQKSIDAKGIRIWKVNQ